MIRLKTLIISFFVIFSMFAQDLSKIDLSKLTPEQMEMYKKYMGSKGTNSTENQKNNPVPENRKTEDSTFIKPQKVVENAVFGSYLFNTQQLSFEPKLNIPTPTNYVIGAYDEIIVDISGLYEASHRLKVSPEGTIRIPNVGILKVSGKTIEDATRNIKSEVSKVYQGVSTGETKISTSLGNIRSIRITLVGEVKRPGTYTLPSLATAFNAIYAGGGPSETGSMRLIHVFRNGKKISTIDVYQFLANGNIPNNVLLHDEDVLKVEPYQSRIILKGAVKHTGIFEAKTGESLQEMIQYAGGFSDKAYTEMATVVRFTKNQQQVINVTKQDFNKFNLQAGDEISFSEVQGKFTNKVSISGAIKRPGLYALEHNQTAKSLIQSAGGVNNEAFLQLAFIHRKKANEIPEIINFKLEDVISGKATDISLQKEDSLVINNLFDYREKFKVSIVGEVKAPGVFPLIDNLTLLDLIVKAKGFTEAASTDSIELIRIVKDRQLLLSKGQKTIIRKFSINKDLKIENTEGNFVLENGDQIVVRRISGYEPVRMVRIEGEVLRPGSYNILSKSENISSLIKRSGGLSGYAYPEGAFLIRNQSFDFAQKKLNNYLTEAAKSQIQKSTSNNIDASLLDKMNIKSADAVQTLDSIQQNLNGSDIVKSIENTEGLVGIDLISIIRNPGGKYDIKLEEGDVIYIPRELQTVRVMGEVFFPTYVRYDRGLSLKDYLNSAGGTTSKALRKRIFVLYPNGTSKSTRNFLGLRYYPQITPGTQILVPQKQIDIKQKMSTGETVTIMTSITSVGALVYSIISSTLNNNSTTAQ